MLLLKELLGDFLYIKIWYDNFGDNFQWFINKIIIWDFRIDIMWYFVCNCWLVVEREDGKIECVFYVLLLVEINSFRNKFYSRVCVGFGDGYIWFLVVIRFLMSFFMCVQCMLCCLFVLMLVMVINVMFYQFGVEDNSGLVQFGFLVLSW